MYEDFPRVQDSGFAPGTAGSVKFLNRELEPGLYGPAHVI